MTAVETTKERWFEAEIQRVAGEIALLSPQRDAAKDRAASDECHHLGIAMPAVKTVKEVAA
jgi:hypothetical protein